MLVGTGILEEPAVSIYREEVLAKQGREVM
jgi:hypothetical protein